MHWLVLTGLVVFASVTAARADSPDPASLAIPPEEVSKARELVQKLGSQAFRERDQATRELFQMGRRALIALREGRMHTDPEVRMRASRLLERAEDDDLKARIEIFLADTEGKYQHELPGWQHFRASAGEDRAARDLFADIIRNKENHSLLLAIRDGAGKKNAPLEELARELTARRMSLRRQVMTPINGQGQGMMIRQVIPEAPDIALILLAESLVPERLAPPGGHQVQPTTYLYQQEGRQMMKGEGKYGEAFRRLTLRWLESQDGPTGALTAMSVAQMVGLESPMIAQYAVRALDAGPPNPVNRANILTVVARHNAKHLVPVLIRHFEDSSRIPLGNNRPELQVRDTALAMALLLTDQDPKDYGFSAQSSRTGPNRFSYTTNYFMSDSKTTADERRTAAFARWKDWERAVYGAAAGPGGVVAAFKASSKSEE